jgi:hypothetical protein
MRHPPLGDEFAPCAECFTAHASQAPPGVNTTTAGALQQVGKKARLRKHYEQGAAVAGQHPMRAIAGVGAYGFIRACPKGSTV